MCCLNICSAVFIDVDLSADKLQNWFKLTAIKNISGNHSHCSKKYIEQIRTSESSRMRDLTSSRILKKSSRFLSNRLRFPWPGWLYTDIPVILYEIVQQLLFLWPENTSDAHQDTITCIFLFQTSLLLFLKCTVHMLFVMSFPPLFATICFCMISVFYLFFFIFI